MTQYKCLWCANNHDKSHEDSVGSFCNSTCRSLYSDLRDQFAMAALTGLMSISQTVVTAKNDADAAFMAADACMKRRLL